MNKKTIIITALFALVAMAGQAQEIKMNESTFSDYLPLLNAKGYMAYSFNTKKFKGVEVEPVVMEYVKGEEFMWDCFFRFTSDCSTVVYVKYSKLKGAKKCNQEKGQIDEFCRAKPAFKREKDLTIH
ncbi:MAG: hypothetical protein IJ196_07835 [Prevotella sp.]|nr:hypothetical protein [Prevotella sp.]